MATINLENTKWPEIKQDSWESRLKKELKTEDLDALKTELEKGIVYDPLKTHTYSDPQSITHFPILSYGQRFDIGDELTLNRCLLSLLKNDLRVVGLKANSKTNWNQIFENVFPELIHLDIEHEDKLSKAHFDNYRQKNEGDSKWSVASIRPKSDLVKLDYKKLEHLSQVELIKSSLWDMQMGDFEKVKVCVNVSENLLEIIPFARALRIQFEEKHPDKKLVIEANCDLSTEDKNDAIIKAGSIYLFCTMAGIDHLYLHTLTNEADLDHCRLMLNVQNIVSLEGGVDTKKDALKGSYVIDELTRQFIEA